MLPRNIVKLSFFSLHIYRENNAVLPLFNPKSRLSVQKIYFVTKEKNLLFLLSTKLRKSVSEHSGKRAIFF